MKSEKAEIFLPLSSELMKYSHYIGRSGTNKYLQMIEDIVNKDDLSFMNSAKVVVFGGVVFSIVTPAHR